MATLQSTLARLGAGRLAEILGKQTVEILEILDIRQLSPLRLADLAIRAMGVDGILLSRRLRNQVVGALGRQDAEHLCELLQIDVTDPWSSLSRLSFQKGQKRTALLFAFFGERPTWDDTRTDLPAALADISPTYPLFDHQRSAYRSTLRFLHSEKPRVMLHLPTGAGKTRTALNIACDLLRSSSDSRDLVIWLAHSEELCDQAAEEAMKAWAALGNRSLSFHRHYGSYRTELPAITSGMLVASLQLFYRDSLAHQSLVLKLGRRAALIIMDEAHQAVAPTYNLLLRLLVPSSTVPLLGLSATPGRSYLRTGDDLQLADFFSRQRVTLGSYGCSDPISFLQNEGFLAKTDFVPLNYYSAQRLTLTVEEKAQIEEGFDLPSTVVSSLAADKARNLLILQHLFAEAGTPGSHILVFACSVEHANMLASVLHLRGFAAAAVSAETPTEQRRQLIQRFRKGEDLQILVNCGVLTTGFDSPNANVAVVARPTQSVVLYSQMVGRVMRGPRANGNERCRILTVVDQISGFRSASEGFGHWEDIWE
jgi:DNA repair protein RadD